MAMWGILRMIRKLNIIAFIMIVSVWTAVAVHSYTYDPAERLAVIPGISDATREMVSGDFSKMSAEERKKIVMDMGKNGKEMHDVMESKAIPEDLKKNIRENLHLIFKDQMMKRVDEYLSLPLSERDAYLEKMMAEMRPPMGGPPPGDRPPPGNGKGARKGPSLSMIKEHIESSTPEERAKMEEFHRQMRAKMGPPPKN